MAAYRGDENNDTALPRLAELSQIPTDQQLSEFAGNLLKEDPSVAGSRQWEKTMETAPVHIGYDRSTHFGPSRIQRDACRLGIYLPYTKFDRTFPQKKNIKRTYPEFAARRAYPEKVERIHKQLN